MTGLLSGPLLKLPSAGGGAMESDASALWWFDSASGTTNTGDGTDVTAWDDETSNAQDLAQASTLDLPTWNATNSSVEFNGSQLLRNSATGLTNRMMGELDGGGEAALFFVFQPDFSGQAASSVAEYAMGAETANNNGNNSFAFSVTHDTTGGSPETSVTARARNGGDAFFAQWVTSSLDATKILIEFWADQTDYELLQDGTVRNSGSVTPANLPDGTNLSVTLGAWSNGTGLFASSYVGEIFEVFATGDASTSNRSAIRSQLNTKHGL